MEWLDFQFIDDLTLLLESNRSFLLHILPLVMLIMVLYSFSFMEVENTEEDTKDEI
ncbi:hypothetical protein OKW21_003245 [Catalinimonas alkaloidigena]|nr:hypothetical protein [Catalinimonas alkaloidigena]